MLRIELIGTRFELGEPIIAMCSRSSERYVNKILKKDFYLDDKLVCEYTADLDKHLE